MFRFAALLCITGFATFIGCNEPTPAARPPRVAVAISLRDAMTEIVAAYQAETKANLEVSFESSGQLLGQIKNGAPIDAFISAGGSQVRDLENDGLTEKGTRRLVAGNTLVLIVPAKLAPEKPFGFADLADARFKRIAAGEPKTVPAGQYAAEVFKSLKIDGALNDRLIYGTNVRQVLDYVERGEVDAGIVYATDAKQSGDKVKVMAAANPEWHSPIEYSGVVIRNAQRGEVARNFLQFLGTEKARIILVKYGFTVPVAAAATTKPVA